jgi:Leucine-rich repeat (LRR) protein
MKRIIYAIAAMLLMGAADATAQVAIVKENFPDSAFRVVVKEKFDKDNNDTLSATEIDKAKDMYMYSGRSIKSMKGIALLPNLIHIFSVGNEISDIDISKNMKLKTLIIYSDSLQSVNVSNDTCLNYLTLAQCSKLKSLDLSESPNLNTLSVTGSSVSSLDLSKCKKLTGINVENNKLDSLDLTKSPLLTEVRFSNNNISSIDLSNNPELSILTLENNNLKAIDLTNNKKLKGFSCKNNKIESLDVTQDTLLTELYCDNNKLTVLDVTKNTNLTYLYFAENGLTKIDLSKNTKLTNLNCYNNQLVALDVSACTGLTSLDASTNIKRVDVNTAGEMDLTTLAPFGFDAAKASNWIGGTVDGTKLTFTGANATYDYDCGNNQTVTFKLIPVVPSSAQLTSGSAVKAFATGNVINILGTDAKAQVIDAAGRTVYAGTDRQITVTTPGLYIVNAAGKAFKVIIR